MAAGALVGPAEATVLKVGGTHKLGAERVVVVGEIIHVRGRAPGLDRVRVAFSRGARIVKSVDAAVETPSGDFMATFTPQGSGKIDIHATQSSRRRINVLRPYADLDDRGPHVRFLQQQLHRLRYAVPLHGRYDFGTARAVVAYRKIKRMRRTTNATPSIYQAVSAGRGAYKVRFPGHGRHVEADLTHQVLALVNRDGSVHKTFTTSAGRPGLPTPVGTFRVYRKHRGHNGRGQWDVSFFKGICGVHGYPWVPTYPASHCCLRVSFADMRGIFNWMPRGTIVDVFYRRGSA